jgi:hypothetical protein
MHGSVLLIGSMPFDMVEDNMRACAEALGNDLACLPDGEVGDRKTWVGFLAMRIFPNHPDLESAHGPVSEPVQPDRNREGSFREEVAQAEAALPAFRIKAGVTGLRFDDLGYARIAQDSYSIFERLRGEGLVPEDVRFQVCLPAPDSAVDSMGEGNYIPYWPRASFEEKFARHTAWLDELWRGIPDQTPLGYHWCYGTWGGWPMTEMKDLGLCVRLSNEAVRRAGRRVDYVHMPVVRHPDEAFFAPLRDLEIGETKVYLGLIHHTDGVEGFRRRVALARRALADFGIASVCGYGRIEPAELPAILEAHRACAAALRQR